MSLLAPPAPHGVPARLTGSPVRWGRDLAIVGGFTALGGAWAASGFVVTPFVVAAAIVAMGTCLVLGIEMPEFLDSARHRMGLATVGLRCAMAGAAAGGFVGLVAAQATGQIFLGPFVVAMVAGALQLGWLWLPYTVLTVLERPTWPVVVAACAVGPAIGWLSAALCQLAVSLVF